MNSEDGQVFLFVYCNFLVLLSTPVCSLKLNKQNVNIADGSLTDQSFLSRYQIKELFKKISNSSLTSHVYWDTLQDRILVSSTPGRIENRILVSRTPGQILYWILLSRTSYRRLSRILVSRTPCMRECGLQAGYQIGYQYPELQVG